MGALVTVTWSSRAQAYSCVIPTQQPTSCSCRFSNAGHHALRALLWRGVFRWTAVEISLNVGYVLRTRGLDGVGGRNKPPSDAARFTSALTFVLLAALPFVMA